MAREGEGAQFDSDPQECAFGLQAAEQLHYMHYVVATSVASLQRTSLQPHTLCKRTGLLARSVTKR